jgi:hypothetical protein
VTGPDPLGVDGPTPIPAVPLGVVVARRDLRTRAGGPVVVLVGAPVQVGNGWDWACPYRIEGLPEVVEGQAFGIDALQALQLATPALRAELERSGAPLSWLGSDFWQAGFPPFVESHGDEDLEGLLLHEMTATATRWIGARRPRGDGRG